MEISDRSRLIALNLIIWPFQVALSFSLAVSFLTYVRGVDQELEAAIICMVAGVGFISSGYAALVIVSYPSVKKLHLASSGISACSFFCLCLVGGAVINVASAVLSAYLIFYFVFLWRGFQNNT